MDCDTFLEFIEDDIKYGVVDSLMMLEYIICVGQKLKLN